MIIQEGSGENYSIDYVKTIIGDNINHFILRNDYSGMNLKSEGILGVQIDVYIAIDKKEHTDIFLPEDTINKWLASINLNFEKVKKQWAKEGFLIKDKEGKYKHNTTFMDCKMRMVRLCLDKGTNGCPQSKNK